MILLTRPLSQVGNLQSLLEDSDLDYVLFPALEINKIDAVAPSRVTTSLFLLVLMRLFIRKSTLVSYWSNL